MNQEPISIIDVKRDAKKLMKGRLGTAIKINIIAIIVTVTTLSMMTFTVYAMIKDTNLMSSADVSSTTTSLGLNPSEVIVSVLQDAAGLTFMWSVSWQLLIGLIILKRIQDSFKLFKYLIMVNFRKVCY